jgi:midasin
MRKVVAFIASNFRRDKIWLRRTRPSRRDYRILIALDNTRSMSHCSVGPKALKAIITVCTAFQRLELGETGLCAFGGFVGNLLVSR